MELTLGHWEKVEELIMETINSSTSKNEAISEWDT